ncbi:MAG: hypothetical protein KGI51_02245 [Rhodospirillales bacterium]|nr:hypothetical protein [Rhodospirillales bacterium]
MMLTEADGKALLAEAGIAIPAGVECAAAEPPPLPFPGPWIAKAQLPAGGRGKAGLIRRCGGEAELRAALPALLGAAHRGHRAETCLIEPAISGAEHYLAVMLDPASYRLRLLHSPDGGTDIETTGATTDLLFDPDTADAALAGLPAPVAAAARALIGLVVSRELLLAEINPLFVTATAAIAADAKLVLDLNALPRQPRLAALIAARPAVYPDALRKLEAGFDYVELDVEGAIGLLTTGAGLSMMLIDELTASGARPLNFCDIRTSMLRGSPARIIAALGWMAARPSLRVVLVNIFAGITDLGEFAALLADALAASPGLRVPVVARLIGRGQDAAARILAERAPAVTLEADLDRALDRVVALAA